MKHILTATVRNTPGVLARIVGVVSGRGYNIETLNVAPTHDPAVSKMTMVVPGDDHVLEQVLRQLDKLVDVLRVSDVTRQRHLNREMILVEVSTRGGRRGDLIELASLFSAQIVGVREHALTIQMVGDENTVEDFLRLLKPHAILDLSRSGTIVVERGE
ncbi:MAG: acetolactate synthase small subunit [Kiritimatiellaeota bacterium]|nr:acetolactate synthase small subunit [Kiritimatiellota bacterium]